MRVFPIFGFRWWACQHISGGEWFAWKVATVFGVPLVTMFFRVVDMPCKTLADACAICDVMNREAGEGEEE